MAAFKIRSGAIDRRAASGQRLHSRNRVKRHVACVFLLALALRVDAEAPQTADEDCIDAAVRSASAPRLPPQAMRDHASGTAEIRVRIASDGPADDVILHSSSGHDALDRSALDAVRSWTFDAMLCGGNEREQWLIIPVDFAGIDVAVVEDEHPMEFASVSEGIDFLERGDFERAGVEPMTIYQDRSRPLMWSVVTGPQGTAIFRTHSELDRRTHVVRHRAMCDGDTQWCNSTVAGMRAFIQENPPPPPPSPLPGA